MIACNANKQRRRRPITPTPPLPNQQQPVTQTRKLHEHLQRVPSIHVLALAELRNIRVERDERIGRTEIKRVVYPPIDLFKESTHVSVQRAQREKWGFTYLADLTRGVEKTLKDVTEEDARTKRDAHSLDSLHNGTNNVRGRLEAVRPHEIHKMHHRSSHPSPATPSARCFTIVLAVCRCTKSRSVSASSSIVTTEST